MTTVFMEKDEIRELIIALECGQFFYRPYEGERCENKEVTAQIEKLQRMLEDCPFQGNHEGILWCSCCNYSSPKWKEIVQA